jgi:hypothetical protein
MAPVPEMPPQAPPPQLVAGPPKLEGPLGTLRLGLLAQAWYQAAGAAAADGTSQNIYLRRIRFLVGGTILRSFDYFFQTDFPNLFLNNGPMGLKNTPGMNVQDVVITYKAVPDVLKIDAGYLLVPLAHNSLQSAASLYGIDYFTYTFLSSNVFGSTANPLGRDLGVQLRGLLLQGHIEYRVGMFQGVRVAPVVAPMPPEVGGRNFFRVAARVQVNLLDPETGYLYGGTYLGAKRILSVGGSYDFQGDYKYWAVDGLLDMPLGPGVATAQVNYARWDPGNGDPVTTTPPTGIPKESAIMAEGGYQILAAQVSPIVKYERLSVSATGASTTLLSGGLAFWPFGHTSNVKAFFTRAMLSPLPAGQHDFNQFQLQWQLFFY